MQDNKKQTVVCVKSIITRISLSQGLFLLDVYFDRMVAMAVCSKLGKQFLHQKLHK